MVSTRVSTRKDNERPKRERRASTKFGNEDEKTSDNKKRTRSTHPSSGNVDAVVVATNGNNDVKNNGSNKKKRVEKKTAAKATSSKKIENKKTAGGKRVDKQPIKAAATVKKTKKVSKTTTTAAAAKSAVTKIVKKKASDDASNNNSNGGGGASQQSNLAPQIEKKEVKVRVRVENKLNKGYRTAVSIVGQTATVKGKAGSKKKVSVNSDKGSSSSSSKPSTGKKDNAVVTSANSGSTRDKIIRVRIKLIKDIHVRVRVQKKLMKENSDDKKYARVNEFHVGDGAEGEGGKKKKQQQALYAITKKKSPKITIRLNKKKKDDASKDTMAAANDNDDNTNVVSSPSKKKTKTSHGNEIEPNRLCIIDGCERYKRARCGGHCLPHYEQLSDTDKAEIAQQVEAKLAKVAPEKKRCRGVDCTKYKKSNHDGYCLTCYREHYGEDAAPGIESGSGNNNSNNNPPLPLPSKETTTGGGGGPPKEKKYCIFDGCMKHKQKGCFGYCLTHKAYANPEQHRLENELAAAESAMKKSTMRPSHFCKFEGCDKYKQSNCNGFCLQHVKSRVAYEDDDLEVVTKVRVRCDKRLHNGFCVAILSDESRAKLGLERPPPMSGDEDMANDDDDEEMEDQDGDTTPAEEKTYSVGNNKICQPDFKISNTIRRKENGALLCKAVGCPKIAQTKQEGFCRNHFNQFMISTGQCESWECKCGMKIAVPSLRCGVCHRWRDGHHPAYTNSPQKSPGIAAPSPVAMTASRPKTYVPEDANVQISDVTLKNARGRVLCKVIGCGKAEQAQNDGFCRTHFNEFAITDGMDEDLSEKWTCECGNEWSVRQKRCGNTRCQKVSYFFSDVILLYDGLVLIKFVSSSSKHFCSFFIPSGEEERGRRTLRTELLAYPRPTSSFKKARGLVIIVEGRLKRESRAVVLVTDGRGASARVGGRLDLRPIMTATMEGLIGHRIGLVTIARMVRSYLPVRLDVANAIAGEAGSVSLLLGNVPSATSPILVAEIDALDAWLGRLKQSLRRLLKRLLKCLSLSVLSSPSFMLPNLSRRQWQTYLSRVKPPLFQISVQLT